MAVHFPTLLGGGFLLVALGMLVLWLWQRRSHNAAIVDVGWTLGLGGLGVAYASLLDGTPGRRWLLGLLIGLWSARLSLHLLRDRILGHEEEGRYKRLRAHWGPKAQPRFLLFFLAQAVLASLLSLAFLPGLLDERPALDAFDLAALLLWTLAWIGEAVADRQLAAFKARPDSAGRVCDVGLWAWSRHPNYFFEWLLWCAFILPGLPGPGGWLSPIAPLFMLVLVLKVSGIPTSEAQALRSRGDAYRRYQQRVSAFFPWPPRPESPS
jgi:steroid 5-alpha reductase family enzyme